MAIMDIFKKKKTSIPRAAPPPVALPIQDVIQMKSQNFPNDQIVAALQARGYMPKEIYDAIAQAESRGPAEPFTPKPSMPDFAPTHTPEVKEKIDIDETVESIIEEKWNELVREIGKFTEWKDKMESRIDKIEQSMVDVKADLDSLHKAIVAKIGDFDKNLLDVGTEIKAMEKVFSKVLPELTGSVAELSRLTNKAKKTK